MATVTSSSSGSIRPSSAVAAWADSGGTVGTCGAQTGSAREAIAADRRVGSEEGVRDEKGPAGRVESAAAQAVAATVEPDCPIVNHRVG